MFTDLEIDPEQFNECSSCQARIFWARTTRERTMPVNAEIDPTGNMTILRGGRYPLVHVHAEKDPPKPGAVLYKSHFATCPDADTWRKR